MPETLTEAVGEKLQELNTKSTCKGNLRQGIVVTTEDKIKLAVSNYRNETKFVFDWPNHLTSILTLIVSLVSMPRDSADVEILCVKVETWKILIKCVLAIFSYMLVRSVFYRVRNRSCISAEALINALSNDQTKDS